MKKYLFMCLLFPVILEGQVWRLIDSVNFTIRIPAGDKSYVYFDFPTQSLKTVLSPDNLISASKQAIARAPDWLKMELAENLSQLDSTNQQRYANIIISASDPYVDEIAFQVAHIAPQTLLSPNIYTEILTQNAELVYEADNYLDYVSIVNYGNSSSGGNYYSTVKYNVEENGDTNEYELPMEYYYWFIVHPKLTMEEITYINPRTGKPTNPPVGKFWRDYIFNYPDTAERTVVGGGNDTIYAGEVSPILRDQFSGVTILWANIRNNIPLNGAIGVITQWVQDVMVFSTPPTRPYQPVRVYHYHQGTCSEHCYLTAAAGRACLIPTVGTWAYKNNHKWNEFYCKNWFEWEPVNTMIADSTTYDTWWQVKGIFNWRGDGYIWTVTQRYSPCCTLLVTVKDATNKPVDCARVKIVSPGFPGSFTTCGWTNINGQTRFLLGDKNSYSLEVRSSIGNYPNTSVISNSVANQLYTHTVNLSGTLPDIAPLRDTLLSNPPNLYKIEYALDAESEFIHGRNIESPNDNFCETVTPGHITNFICDETNFSLYNAGRPFRAFHFVNNVSSMDTNFVLPKNENWYLVFSNENKAEMTEVISAKIYLYKDISGVAERNLTPSLFEISPTIATKNIKINYYIPNNTFVELGIYDLTGREICVLVKNNTKSGYYTNYWNSSIGGVYFVKLRTENYSCTKKFTILR